MKSNWSSAVRWLVFIACAGAAMPAHAQRTLLAPGMELTYASNAQQSPPWRVESVERGLELGGRRECLRVLFAAGGPRAGPDLRVTCADTSVLAAWDSVQRSWRPSRPLRAGGVLEVRSGANTARYTVDGESQDTVSGIALRVLSTHVVTRDSSGREIRRLRERYAPELGTATWGAFENPDAAAPGGWRVTQEFRLVAIRVPSR